jgi:hypothetical protein
LHHLAGRRRCIKLEALLGELISFSHGLLSHIIGWIKGIKPTSTPVTLIAAERLAAETKSATNNIFMLNNAKQYQSNIIYTITMKEWKPPLNKRRWSLYFLLYNLRAFNGGLIKDKRFKL